MKTIFDILFIIISAVLLIVLSEFELLDEFVGFWLIPILIAYLLGKYSERKFNNK